MQKPEEVQKLKRDLKTLKTNLAFQQRKLTVLKGAAVCLANSLAELSRPANTEPRRT